MLFAIPNQNKLQFPTEEKPCRNRWARMLIRKLINTIFDQDMNTTTQKISIGKYYFNGTNPCPKYFRSSVKQGNFEIVLVKSFIEKNPYTIKWAGYLLFNNEDLIQLAIEKDNELLKNNHRYLGHAAIKYFPDVQ
jgi:hypothetical protein